MEHFLRKIFSTKKPSDSVGLRNFYTVFKASAVTKISEASEWTTSKIIEENQSAHHGPIEPLHMDYIIRKLVDDSLPKLDALLDE